MLDRPEACSAQMHQGSRSGQESSSWMMRLKAIANPGDRRRGSRWRSAPERHRPARARRGSVLDTVRLHLDSLWAPKGTYLRKTGLAPGLFHVRPQRAVRGCGAESTRLATAGSARSVRTVPHSALATVRQGPFGGPSPANLYMRNEEVGAQPVSWPVTGLLATEVRICGQIERNALVIQGDLATDRRAEMLRNPCLHAVMRGCRPRFL